MIEPCKPARTVRGISRGLAVAVTLSAPIAVQARDVTLATRTDTTSIDPQFHNVSPNNAIAHYAFDQLIQQDERQRLIPGLALSWTAVGPTSWEFKLHPDVLWHDGKPFTADDVVFSLARVPTVPNSPSSFAIYTKSVASAEVVNPLTVRIETRGTAPLLPYDISALSIVARHAAEGHGTADFNSGVAAIGTGPYRFVHWEPGDRVQFAANPSWWGGKPSWDHVTVRPIANDAARTSALLSGDIDLMDGVPAADTARLRADPRLSVFQCDSDRVIFLAMDTARERSPGITDAQGKPLDRNPLKDHRVREALSRAIDRAALTGRLLDGQARPAGQFMPQGFFGTSDRLPPQPADPEGARRLLAEAGYPQGFGLRLAATNDRYPMDATVAQAIAQMFSRIGVHTEVDAMPASMLFSRGSNLEFSALIAGWIAASGEASSPLVALAATYDAKRGYGSSNRGRYSNPEMDRLLDEGLHTLDDGKRSALLAQATEVLVHDEGILPMYFLVNTWATRKGLHYAARADEQTLATSLTPEP